MGPESEKVLRIDIIRESMPRRNRSNQELRPIGTIRSPFKSVEEIPRDCSSITGEVRIFPEYEQGLKDIDGFSHLVVLWLFHLSESYSLIVKPLFYKGRRGVFATRHPDRPNSIGLSVVEFLEERGNVLRVRGLDAIDGSPVLDIKPYVSMDSRRITRGGWLDKV